MSTSAYIPGTCNIGPTEIAMRKRIGWTGLLITLGLWIVLAAYNVSAPWFLLLFFPAMGAATGFLQAALHFCVAFGFKGVFNLVNKLTVTEPVQQAAFRAQDRRKAFKIFSYSVGIGVLVAGIAYFVH